MKIPFLSLFVIFMLLCGQNSTAQVISGRISDRNTGLSLPGVHVIYKQNSGSLSDGGGNYSVNVERGIAEISFSFMGYSTINKEVDIAATDTFYLNIELSPDITAINEIVVSASKGEQKISDLTVSLSLIKPFQLSRNHIINAEEALHKTSGIEITDGQASIRGGSGYSYGAGSRVLTLIDGLPALSSDAGSIKWGTLPIENISRIEVIKGASSVLYGSSALNGVVNFISRNAEIEPITRVTLSAGIYDNPRNSNWLWWDTPRMIQNIAFNHSEVYGMSQIGIGARVMNDNGYRKYNDDKNARLSLNFSRKSAKFSSLKYGLSLYSSYTAKNDFLLWKNAFDGGLIQSTSTAMEYRGLSLAIDPFISFQAKGGLRHKFVSRLMTNLNRLPDNKNNNSDSHSIYTEYQISYNSWSGITLIGGIVGQYSVINSNFYGNHQGLNIAAFSQADLKLSERLSAVAGVRIEEYMLDSEAERPVPIFRTGLNLELSPLTFLRASFGQGYRYPSIAEKHAYTTVGAVRIFPNSDIRAERGWSSEIGLKRAISSGVLSGNIDLALFYSKNRDMIEYVFGWWFDPIEGTYAFGFQTLNIENSSIYGLEYSFDLSRPFGSTYLTVSGSYTYVYPVEIRKMVSSSKPDYLKYRRKHSAKLSATLQFKKFSTELVFFAKSKLLDIDDVFLKEESREDFLPGFYDYWLENNNAFTLLDLNIAYRIGEAYNISFVIKNVGNTEYMGRPGDIQPHRYYSLQLSGTF